MAIDLSDSKVVLSNIGSIHLQDLAGKRCILSFSELDEEGRKTIEELVLRSSDLFDHLKKQSGSFNIVYREKVDRDVILIAGKEIKPDGGREEETDEGFIKKAQASAEPVGVFADGLSLSRNTISSLFKNALENPHSKTSISVNGLGIIGGGAGFAGGAIAISKGVQKMANAKENEEFDLGVFQTIFGAGYLGSGISSILYRASSLIESASSFSQAVLTYGLNPALVLMNASLALMGLYKIAITGSFRSEFNQAIEKEGMQGGVEFLYRNLFLTEEEKQVIQNLPEEERVEETKKILDRKREHLERRIGTEALEEIAPKVEALKHSFDMGRADSEHIAKGVLETVSKGNYKEISKAAMLLTLSVLGIVAVAAVGPTGTFVFFAALALLWLLFDCTKTNNFTTEQLWKIYQLLMSLTILATEGVDEHFMAWLSQLDSTFENANDEVKANTYVNARTELNGGIYDLYCKAKEAPEFLLAMAEIRKASFACDLNTREERFDALCSAMPNFYNLMANEFTDQEIELGLNQGYEELSFESKLLPKETQLKFAALRMLDKFYDYKIESDTLRFDGHPDGPSRLSRSSPF